MHLQLCNCVFWDPKKKQFSVEHLENSYEHDSPYSKSPLEALKNFYNDNKKIFTIDAEKRKDWSKVIQDWPHFSTDDENAPFNTNKIVYKKNKNSQEGGNEVKSGLINMMNLLMKITNKKESYRKEFWRGLSQNNIVDKLKQLLNSLKHPSCQKVATEVIDSIKEFASLGRKDFEGTITLRFS